MTFNTHTRQQLLVQVDELMMCAQRIEQTLRDEDRQHELPGAINDANDALVGIVASASCADATFAQALANGARSTALPAPCRGCDGRGWVQNGPFREGRTRCKICEGGGVERKEIEGVPV